MFARHSIALVLALSLGCQAFRGAAPHPGDDTGDQPHASTTPWPVEPTDGVFDVAQAYGQYEDGSFHGGADLLARHGTTVKAIAAGEVVRLYELDDPYAGLIVGSPDEEGTGWVYLHLAKSSITKRLNDKVVKGEKLGEVVEWTEEGGAAFSHLHLAMAREYSPGDLPVWNYYESNGNPLKQLANHDTTKPEVLSVGQHPGFHFGYHAADGSEPHPLEIPTGTAIDIVVRTYDRYTESSDYPITPYSVSLEIRRMNGSGAPGVAIWQERPLVLDHRPEYPVNALIPIIYHENTVGTPSERDFYFFGTHSMGGPQLRKSDGQFHWKAETGKYEIRALVTDAGDNVAELVEDIVSVGAP